MPASDTLDRRSLTALMLEWLVIVLAIGGAVQWATWWAAALAYIVVATRQHALLVLYHDAVHGHFSRVRRVNDGLINVTAGVPLLMPVELYRPLHMEHHQMLGTDRDPERQLLYARQAWNYRPLPTATLARQLLGDFFVVNGIRTLIAWRKARPLPSIQPQTLVITALWLAGVVLWFLIAPRTALAGLALWFAPLLTLTQLLQKVRSYAEHSGGPNVTPGWPDWTYSWRASLIGRLTIWPYHINYHREHHGQPGLPWHQLPAAANGGPGLASSDLWKILALPAYATSLK